MDRRKFLRNASLIAAGVVAADQLEILERLTWKRRLFVNPGFSKEYAMGFQVTQTMIDDDLYGAGMWDVDFADIGNTIVRIQQVDSRKFYVDHTMWRGVQGA